MRDRKASDNANTSFGFSACIQCPAPGTISTVARGNRVRITNAANDQLRFRHPENPDWAHFSFCLFAGPLERDGTHLSAGAAVAIQPGKIDRSPTGTAASARMALLHASGEMRVGDTFTARSIIGSEFHGRIAGTAAVGDRAAIIPEITGRAWITGVHQHMLDPDDPWPEGYRLSDTWPKMAR